MSIDSNGWLHWVTRIPGIADKVYSQANSGLGGIACHSVVGSETEFQDGIPNRFLDTSKTEAGSYTANAAASCMFILRRSGKVIQMYPVTASTWTSGGREANTSTWAIEAEGGLAPDYGEPLTAAATASFIRICREWEARFGRKLVPGLTVRQHKDLAKQYGTDATACASDRYAAAWLALVKEEKMADPLVAKLVAALGGEAAIDDWNARGNSLLAGYALEQQKLGEHLGNHPGNPGGSPVKVGPHGHKATVTTVSMGEVVQ